MNIVKFEDVNTKFDPTNITPLWDKWTPHHTEMLFNKTEANTVDLRAVQTDSGLLARCT